MKVSSIPIIEFVVDRGIQGISATINEYNTNYFKRRDCGFPIIPAVKGAAVETKRWIKDTVSGTPHISDVPLMTFGDDK